MINVLDKEAQFNCLVYMDNLLNPANAHQWRCPQCQSPLNKVVVHGHEQYVTCQPNIFDCCSGDTCETDHNCLLDIREGDDAKCGADWNGYPLSMLH